MKYNSEVRYTALELVSIFLTNMEKKGRVVEMQDCSRRHGENRNRVRSLFTNSYKSMNNESTFLRKQLKFLKKEVKDLRHNPLKSAAIWVSDEQKIPVFDSAKEGIMVKLWVTKVDTLAKRYKWSNEYIIRIISSRVRRHAHARQWYYDNEHTKNDTSWIEMKIGMMNILRFRYIKFNNLTVQNTSNKYVSLSDVHAFKNIRLRFTVIYEKPE